jgi:uncharacterized metal-binding protein YceD (DUF177 family)
MGKTKYIINTGGLSVGNHEFEFEVTGKFFVEQESSEVSNANVKVKAMLLKQNNVLQLEFDLSGTVALDCDRCLKEFDFPIAGQEKLLVKYGSPENSTDEVLMIPEGETQLNVTQNIYEYILTAIPARRVPCEIDKKRFKCDTEMLQKLNESSTSVESTDENNPMWEKLNKIKLNKN